MSANWKVFWISEDGQASMDMGEYDTEQQARAYADSDEAWDELRAHGHDGTGRMVVECHGEDN